MSKDGLFVCLLLTLCLLLCGCQAPRQATVDVKGYGAEVRVTFHK